MSKHVLSRSAIETRLPLWESLVAWLALDRFQAPGWVWGLVGAFIGLAWIVAVHRLCTENAVERTDLLK